MLWLALQFPRLALDTRPGAEAQSEPLAIIETQGQRRMVSAANAAARIRGVRAGQMHGAAQALCAQLRTEARRPQDEDAAVQNLALWALGYSAQVARHGASTLLVEIGASCRLFGSERKLLQAIAADLEAESYGCIAGVAVTPAAARLLARAGIGRIVRDADTLRTTVVPLALVHGDLPAETCDALAAVGVRSYGELLRLPRAEVARRFGQIVPDHLDTLFGQRAEVVVPIRIDERFRQHLEWPYAITSSTALLFPARRLLVAAAHWLVACQRATTRLRLSFAHEGRANTVVDLGLGQASADREHLIAVVRARLERLVLPQGCVALTLELTETQALDAPSRDLFVRRGESPEDAQQLIDRLQGRLGDAAVERFAVHADHRPERASVLASVRDARPSSALRAPSPRSRGEGKETPSPRAAERGWRAAPGEGQSTPPHRPMFLLSQPMPIERWPGFDWRKAKLSLPERIESGWWDEADATRDYYRIDQTDGVRLWVFQNRQAPRDWFVQGVYA